MDPILLVLSWLVAFLAGIELGGRWAAWVARKAVRYAGFECEFECALRALSHPSNWRNP